MKNTTPSKDRDTFIPAPADSELAPLEDSPGPGYQPRQLVLLGAGDAHLHVLRTLALRPLVGVRITLVAPHNGQMCTDMMPGLVAGHYAQDHCVFQLEPLVRRSGVRWLKRSVIALDANARQVTLDDGSTLHYDWLGVNTGTVQYRAQLEQRMPGAREFGVFLRPAESFTAVWPQVASLGETRALRMTVIGSNTAASEIAMAIRRRLPGSAVTLLCAAQPPGAGLPAVAQKSLLQALRRHNIAVIQDTPRQLREGVIELQTGARLASDVAVIATDAQAAPWLAPSGLTLDADGCITVDGFQRSASHPEVFAAGDICQRPDRPLPRGTSYGATTGPALAYNLTAAIQGKPLRTRRAPARTLSFVTCGHRHAIAVWGGLSAQGHWVWRLKDWMDRRFMNRMKR